MRVVRNRALNRLHVTESQTKECCSCELEQQEKLTRLENDLAERSPTDQPSLHFRIIMHNNAYSYSADEGIKRFNARNR